MASKDRRQRLIQRFRSTAFDRLERIQAAYAQLRETPDDAETTKALMREIHTLKGEAKLMSFPVIGDVAHRVEALLFLIRDRHFRPTRDHQRLLNTGLNTLAELVQEPTQEQRHEVEPFLQRVDGLLDAPAQEPHPPSTDPETLGRRQAFLIQFKTTALERVQRMGERWEQLLSTPNDVVVTADLMREVHTLKGEAKLLKLSEINRLTHAFETLLFALKERRFQATHEEKQLVNTGLALLRSCAARPDDPEEPERIEALIHRIDAHMEADVPSVPEPVSEAGVTPSSGAQLLQIMRTDESIRVGFDKLDELSELVGRLREGHDREGQHLQALQTLHAAWQRSLIQLGREIADIVSDSSRTARERVTELGHLIELRIKESRSRNRDLGQLMGQLDTEAFERGLQLAEFQDHTTELRLVPLSTLFEGYPKAIRELGQELGKNVRVEIQGIDVSLDKQVLDHISAPLLHLVRNSVDHGIESPEVRLRQGKSRVGTLTLKAEHRGTRVELSIMDDGAGVAPATIRAHAVERGLVSSDEAAALSDEETFDLLFAPGFSTRREVTEISGRGVGLDVVKQSILRIGGSVSLESTPGQGTTIDMRVPVSVAITRVLVVADTEGHLFAFPVDAVEAVRTLAADEHAQLGEGEAFRYEGSLVSLRSLTQLLDSGPADSRESLVVVVAYGDQRLGVRTHRHIGVRTVLHRATDPFIESVRVLQGTANSESGEVILLLNIPELIDIAGGATVFPEPRVEPDEGQRQRVRRVLVVDDSELTRDLMVRILMGHGLHIIEAVNGRDALQRMAQATPDLVLTDLDMPVLDGFGLLREIRQHSNIRSVPVVVLSTRGSVEDKKRALELGADAYIVKSEFNEAYLISTLRRFLD